VRRARFSPATRQHGTNTATATAGSSRRWNAIRNPSVSVGIPFTPIGITAHAEVCVEIDTHGEIGVGHKEGIGAGGAPPGLTLSGPAPSANVSNADHLTDQNGPFTEIRTGRGASVSVGDAPCGDGKVVSLSVGPGDFGASSIGVSDSSINPIGR
jgi:hypothetical protein